MQDDAINDKSHSLRYCDFAHKLRKITGITSDKVARDVPRLPEVPHKSDPRREASLRKTLEIERSRDDEPCAVLWQPNTKLQPDYQALLHPAEVSKSRLAGVSRPLRMPNARDPRRVKACRDVNNPIWAIGPPSLVENDYVCTYEETCAVLMIDVSDWPRSKHCWIEQFPHEKNVDRALSHLQELSDSYQEQMLASDEDALEFVPDDDVIRCSTPLLFDANRDEQQPMLSLDMEQDCVVIGDNSALERKRRFSEDVAIPVVKVEPEPRRPLPKFDENVDLIDLCLDDEEAEQLPIKTEREEDQSRKRFAKECNEMEVIILDISDDDEDERSATTLGAIDLDRPLVKSEAEETVDAASLVSEGCLDAAQFNAAEQQAPVAYAVRAIVESTNFVTEKDIAEINAVNDKRAVEVRETPVIEFNELSIVHHERRREDKTNDNNNQTSCLINESNAGDDEPRKNSDETFPALVSSENCSAERQEIPMTIDDSNSWEPKNNDDQAQRESVASDNFNDRAPCVNQAVDKSVEDEKVKETSDNIAIFSANDQGTTLTEEPREKFDDAPGAADAGVQETTLSYIVDEKIEDNCAIREQQTAPEEPGASGQDSALFITQTDEALQEKASSVDDATTTVEKRKIEDTDEDEDEDSAPLTLCKLKRRREDAGDFGTSIENLKIVCERKSKITRRGLAMLARRISTRPYARRMRLSRAVCLDDDSLGRILVNNTRNYTLTWFSVNYFLSTLRSVEISVLTELKEFVRRNEVFWTERYDHWNREENPVSIEDVVETKNYDSEKIVNRNSLYSPLTDEDKNIACEDAQIEESTITKESALFNYFLPKTVRESTIRQTSNDPQLTSTTSKYSKQNLSLSVISKNNDKDISSNSFEAQKIKRSHNLPTVIVPQQYHSKKPHSHSYSSSLHSEPSVLPITLTLKKDKSNKEHWISSQNIKSNLRTSTSEILSIDTCDNQKVDSINTSTFMGAEISETKRNCDLTMDTTKLNIYIDKKVPELELNDFENLPNPTIINRKNFENSLSPFLKSRVKKTHSDLKGAVILDAKDNAERSISKRCRLTNNSDKEIQQNINININFVVKSSVDINSQAEKSLDLSVSPNAYSKDLPKTYSNNLNDLNKHMHSNHNNYDYITSADENLSLSDDDSSNYNLQIDLSETMTNSETESNHNISYDKVNCNYKEDLTKVTGLSTENIMSNSNNNILNNSLVTQDCTLNNCMKMAKENKRKMFKELFGDSDSDSDSETKGMTKQNETASSKILNLTAVQQNLAKEKSNNKPFKKNESITQISRKNSAVILESNKENLKDTSVYDSELDALSQNLSIKNAKKAQDNHINVKSKNINENQMIKSKEIVVNLLNEVCTAKNTEVKNSKENITVNNFVNMEINKLIEESIKKHKSVDNKTKSSVKSIKEKSPNNVQEKLSSENRSTNNSGTSINKNIVKTKKKNDFISVSENALESATNLLGSQKTILDSEIPVLNSSENNISSNESVLKEDKGRQVDKSAEMSDLNISNSSISDTTLLKRTSVCNNENLKEGDFDFLTSMNEDNSQYSDDDDYDVNLVSDIEPYYENMERTINTKTMTDENSHTEILGNTVCEMSIDEKCKNLTKTTNIQETIDLCDDSEDEVIVLKYVPTNSNDVLSDNKKTDNTSSTNVIKKEKNVEESVDYLSETEKINEFVQSKHELTETRNNNENKLCSNLEGVATSLHEEFSTNSHTSKENSLLSQALGRNNTENEHLVDSENMVSPLNKKPLTTTIIAKDNLLLSEAMGLSPPSVENCKSETTVAFIENSAQVTESMSPSVPLVVNKTTINIEGNFMSSQTIDSAVMSTETFNFVTINNNQTSSNIKPNLFTGNVNVDINNSIVLNEFNMSKEIIAPEEIKLEVPTPIESNDEQKDLQESLDILKKLVKQNEYCLDAETSTIAEQIQTSKETNNQSIDNVTSPSIIIEVPLPSPGTQSDDFLRTININVDNEVDKISDATLNNLSNNSTMNCSSLNKSTVHNSLGSFKLRNINELLENPKSNSSSIIEKTALNQNLTYDNAAQISFNTNPHLQSTLAKGITNVQSNNIPVINSTTSQLMAQLNPTSLSQNVTTPLLNQPTNLMLIMPAEARISNSMMQANYYHTTQIPLQYTIQPRLAPKIPQNNPLLNEHSQSSPSSTVYVKASSLFTNVFAQNDSQVGTFIEAPIPPLETLTWIMQPYSINLQDPEDVNIRKVTEFRKCIFGKIILIIDSLDKVTPKKWKENIEIISKGEKVSEDRTQDLTDFKNQIILLYQAINCLCNLSLQNDKLHFLKVIENSINLVKPSKTRIYSLNEILKIYQIFLNAGLVSSPPSMMTKEQKVKFISQVKIYFQIYKTDCLQRCCRLNNINQSPNQINPPISTLQQNLISTTTSGP